MCVNFTMQGSRQSGTKIRCAQTTHRNIAEGPLSYLRKPSSQKAIHATTGAATILATSTSDRRSNSSCTMPRVSNYYQLLVDTQTCCNTQKHAASIRLSKSVKEAIKHLTLVFAAPRSHVISIASLSSIWFLCMTTA